MTKEHALKVSYNIWDAIDLLAETYRKDKKKDKKETADAYRQLVEQDRKATRFNRWKNL